MSRPNLLPLEETSHHKSKHALSHRTDHRSRFRAEQQVIDAVVAKATSVRSSAVHPPSPPGGEHRDVSFEESHADYNSGATMQEIAARREELRKYFSANALVAPSLPLLLVINEEKEQAAKLQRKRGSLSSFDLGQLAPVEGSENESK
mmetsp:Transcript_843/g.1768  ORF Transcript_843/g.1768 Transcript_843/m.1768 type:complete len:148 (-) Transcript_843:371-814(-)